MKNYLIESVAMAQIVIGESLRAYTEGNVDKALANAEAAVQYLKEYAEELEQLVK